MTGSGFGRDYTTIAAEDLILACVNGGGEAVWVEFVRRFQPLIAGVIMRIARQWGEAPQDIVDDLIQETYLRLCANAESLARQFKPIREHAVYGYIKVFAANLAHDYFKRLYATKRGHHLLSTLPGDDVNRGSVQGENSAEQSMQHAVLISEIEAALRNLQTGTNAKRDRRIFWLYYRVGLSASAIAALPTISLSIKGVESTLLRLTRHVRQELLRREAPKGASREKGIPPVESL